MLLKVSLDVIICSCPSSNDQLVQTLDLSSMKRDSVTMFLLGEHTYS